MGTRRTRRAMTVTAAVTALGITGLWSAAGAQAHVRVTADDATQGGYSLLTFRVPTESATASTTELTVQLPTENPIASVSVQPQAGWTFTVKQEKLNPPIKTDDGELTEAPSQITWKAESAADAIKPGEFQQFNISAGPLPMTSSISFKAIQTYSDGEVVKWIQEAAPGSTEEPQYPAPTLELAAATSGNKAAGSSSAAPSVTATNAAASSDDSASSGAATTGIVLGIIGVLLGAAALVLTLRRRTAAPAQI